MHSEVLINSGPLICQGKEYEITVSWISETSDDSYFLPTYYLLFENNSDEDLRPCIVFADEIGGQKNEQLVIHKIELIDNIITFFCSFESSVDFLLYISPRKMSKNEITIIKQSPLKR